MKHCLALIFSLSLVSITAAQTKAPDYSNLYYWAAHPDKRDMADSIPAFLKGGQTEQLADVFFVYPTTFTKNAFTAVWNADINDQALNDDTDARPILFQASVFNGSCKIYAPRYRQAHLKAFFNRESPKSVQAFDLAYSDVRAAFQYYLDHYNHGRPIIIASHSQGTLHAIRLVQEFFDGKPLQKQLVCAYLVGYQIKKDAFKTIPIGENATATGCFVGWRSYQTGYKDYSVSVENGDSQCVNPISWTTLTTVTDKQQHLGLIGLNFNQLIPHAVSVNIDDATKVLFVDAPVELTSKFGNLKNYHILDYNLFYMNIRTNVKQRVDAYLLAHH